MDPVPGWHGNQLVYRKEGRYLFIGRTISRKGAHAQQICNNDEVTVQYYTSDSIDYWIQKDNILTFYLEGCMTDWSEQKFIIIELTFVRLVAWMCSIFFLNRYLPKLFI